MVTKQDWYYRTQMYTDETLSVERIRTLLLVFSHLKSSSNRLELLFSDCNFFVQHKEFTIFHWPLNKTYREFIFRYYIFWISSFLSPGRQNISWESANFHYFTFSSLCYSLWVVSHLGVGSRGKELVKSCKR